MPGILDNTIIRLEGNVEGNEQVIPSKRLIRGVWTWAPKEEKT